MCIRRATIAGDRHLKSTFTFNKCYNHFSVMSFPVRFYYDPFFEFDRVFEDAFVARCDAPSTVVEGGRNSGNSEHQLPFRPRYVLNQWSQCYFSGIYL